MKKVSPVATAVALIEMGIGDTSISYALKTCALAGINRVIVKDDFRSAADYGELDDVKSFSARPGAKIIFLKKRQNFLDVVEHTRTVLIEIPPDCYAKANETRDLIASAHFAGKNRSGYKRFATAPMLELVPHWTNGFVLLHHVFFALMGLFIGFRMHRATYMRATVLVHEADFTGLPEEKNRAADKEPFAFGRTDVRFKPPADRLGMNVFLHIAHHETMSLRRFVLLALYCFFLAFPFWEMRHGWPFSSEYSLHHALLLILSPMRIVGWGVHLLLALYYTNTYFPDTSYLHAFFLPLYAILMIPLVIYSKVGWNGLDGKMPTLTFSRLLPSQGSSRFVDLDDETPAGEDEEDGAELVAAAVASDSDKEPTAASKKQNGDYENKLKELEAQLEALKKQK